MAIWQGITLMQNILKKKGIAYKNKADASN